MRIAAYWFDLKIVCSSPAPEWKIDGKNLLILLTFFIISMLQREIIFALLENLVLENWKSFISLLTDWLTWRNILSWRLCRRSWDCHSLPGSRTSPGSPRDGGPGAPWTWVWPWRPLWSVCGSGWHCCPPGPGCGWWWCGRSGSVSATPRCCSSPPGRGWEWAGSELCWHCEGWSRGSSLSFTSISYLQYVIVVKLFFRENFLVVLVRLSQFFFSLIGCHYH